jgi:hypothetical protein
VELLVRTGEQRNGEEHPPPDSDPLSDAESAKKCGCLSMQKRRSFSSSRFLRGHYEIKSTANSSIALSSSTNAVSISSARMKKRFP